jgi:Ser/Thr protein kinase RdoA (MazF antagonist)
MGRADVYLQPDAPDPVLTEQTVLAIAAAHTDRAGGVLEVDESGGEARAYMLGGDVVVKTQRPHRLRPRTSLAKEAALLAHLAAPLGERVPHLFGHGHEETPQGQVEYLVISRMPGRAARHVPVAGARRETLLRETGVLLARIHAAPTGPLLAQRGLFPLDADTAALRRRLELDSTDLADLLAQHPERWSLPMPPEKLAEHALALLPRTFAPVALHSNPSPTYVFCDEHGALTGIIDFGDAYLSHPAFDLHRWPDPADRVLLREGYLHGREPGDGFDAAWTAAMIYTDIAVIASRPELADAAAADLSTRTAAL